MRKIHLSLALISTLLIQPVFAAEGMLHHSKSCHEIAKACDQAGYAHHNKDNEGNFWMSCMKPVILGKEVKGVKISSATVKECRTDKISELKNELNELENVSSN